MKDQPIRLALPTTGPEELAEISAVLATGSLAQGPKVEEFEQAVAATLGVDHALATSSATTALHLALAAAGVAPGDDVLVPDFTFPATGNVVVQQGARPILVDVDERTYTIDPEDLARKVTPRSRAVMPVHTFGLPADMDAVRAVAERHGLIVVEDAACALGTTYREIPCGRLGDVACFSFHARKVITTGEGGLLATDDRRIAARARLLRSHGGTREGGRYSFVEAGFNYRLSDIQAAVGVAQLRRLPTLLAARRVVAQRLDAALHGIDGVTTPAQPTWGGHSYQSYVVRLDARVRRNDVITHMATRGIETTIGTYALHSEPYYRKTHGYQVGDLPRSYAAYRQTLALPLHPAITVQDVARIAATLAEAIAAAS